MSSTNHTDGIGQVPALVADHPASVPVEQVDGWQDAGRSVVIVRMELPAGEQRWRLCLSPVEA